jgi:hypothetical protein
VKTTTNHRERIAMLYQESLASRINAALSESETEAWIALKNGYPVLQNGLPVDSVLYFLADSPAIIQAAKDLFPLYTEEDIIAALSFAFRVLHPK